MTSEMWLTIVLGILTVVLTIVGFLAVNTLNDIKTNLSKVSSGLQEIVVDFVKYTSRTDAILQFQEKKIESHDNELALLKEKI